MEKEEQLRIYATAQSAYHRQEWNKAIQVFQALLTQPLPPELRAAVLNDLGVAWQKEGNLEKALAAYEVALTLERSLGTSERLATLLINLAGAYQEGRRFKEATKAYEQGLVLLQELRAGDPLSHGLAWRNVGSGYLALAQESRAVWAFQKSLDILEGVGAKREIGITLHRLGEAYLAKYKWPEALGAYRQASAIWESLADRRSLAANYYGRGQVYYDWEKYGEAEKHFQAALEIYRQEKDTDGEALTLASLGRVCAAIKQWEKGEAFYRQAVEQREKMDDGRGLALALWGRASFFFAKGERVPAVADMQRAVVLLQELKDPELKRAEHYLDIFRHKRPEPLGKYL